MSTAAGPVKAEDIAKLWMNENAIVNQKTAYFTAVSAGIAAVFKDSADAQAISFLCVCGVIVSCVAFFSIARTCAYRRHLRQQLEQWPDYGHLFNTMQFRWFERVRSNLLLTSVPLVAAAAWLAAGIYRYCWS